MKIKKKTAMIISFTLGSLIFATTAIADIANKSGYEQLKNTIKYTAEAASSKLDSYTFDFSFVMKDNGQILASDNEISKFDRLKKAQQNTSVRENAQTGTNKSQFYSDPTTMITKDEKSDAYYVTEYTEPRKMEAFNNPFNGDRAGDLEKIADAVVGNLKDQVIVKENPDGTKDFSGNLNEVQIPTLVNAVASFQLKQSFNGYNSQMPHLTQDIFIKEVNGSAHVNQEGLLENLLGTVSISGKDDQGKNHEITVELLFKLSGINSTVVEKPNLEGQKVIKNKVKPTSGSPQITNPEKFIGKYHNDIILEKDGKFVKIGERILEITQMDQKSFSGKYYETYKPGYQQEASDPHSFTFTAGFNTGKNQDPFGADFEVTNKDGSKSKWNIHFDDHLGKIYLSPNGPYSNYDSLFTPDLD